MARALRRPGLVGLLLLATAIVPQAAQAARGGLHLSVNRSKQRLTTTITGTAGATKCELHVSADSQRAAFTDWKVNHHVSVRFSWTVPSDAPSGVWAFTATCDHRKLKTSVSRHVRLRYHGSGRGALVAASNAVPGGGKGGGNQSCQPIESGGSGQVCFINDPFASYQGGTDVGQCTWYAAGMRPDLDGIDTGDAADWLKEAAGKRPEGTTPEVGAIAVNKTADGGVGHVAYVAGVANGGATLILDEANLHNKGGVFLNVSTPASDFQGYIYGGPSSPPTTTNTPSAPSLPSGTYAETTGGVSNTWSDYQTASGTQGPSIGANQTVGITCRIQGFTVADGNDWWYLVGSSPWNSQYYVSADAFYNNGSTSGSLANTPFVDQKVALCPTNSGGGSAGGSSGGSGGSSGGSGGSSGGGTPSSPPPPPTWNETVGSVAHTWTDYQDAGGNEGPEIADHQTVQITCRVQGFTVSDGNDWWYEIASSPWNNAYFVSADAFYNNGATSGSLSGTPFVDTNVATC